jgi:hypothetical protein
MRKWLVLFTLVSLLLVTGSVSAQGEVIINELQVRLWPEYDRPNLLVIYDFVLAPGTTLPAKATLRIPLDAEVIAVANFVNGQLTNVPFEGPVTNGEWQEVTMSITSNSAYHLEYYTALQKNGSNRHFNYIWPGDYSINTLVVEVQEPVNTTSFSSKPALPNTGKSENGLSLHSGTFGSVKAGEQWVLGVDYTRSTDELSATGQGVQPGGDLLDQTGATNSATTQFLARYLPYILASVAVLLIAVGVAWYWLSGRDTTSGHRGRKRHSTQPVSAQSDQAYCHQCGKRAQPGDKFCRACGIRLRREE